MENTFVLSVTNHHSEDCGLPPNINADGDRYVGYFESELGEQAVFVFDRDRKEGTLYLGDAGWDKPYPVRNGVAAGLMLGEIERAWLTVCWRAAQGC
jgi:hypothetical protein